MTLVTNNLAVVGRLDINRFSGWWLDGWLVRSKRHRGSEAGGGQPNKME